MTIPELAESMAARLLARLDERIELSMASREEIWLRAGVSKNKLPRARERGNIDLVGLLAILMAHGLDPGAFIQVALRPPELDGLDDDEDDEDWGG